MLGFRKKIQKVKPLEDGTINLNENKLTKSLTHNMKIIETIFADDETILLREFYSQGKSPVKCCICFINGMVNNVLVNENIMRPIMTKEIQAIGEQSIDYVNEKILFSNEVLKSQDMNEIIEAVAYGDTALLIDGASSVLIINSKGWQVRGITEPESEKVLRGPREGFTEGILGNLSLIRRKINTSDLKFKFKSFGTRTNTKVCICYIDSLVDKNVLDELNNRLDKIKIDGVLDSNYIVEYIKDARLSPFKTIGITERPDTVAGKLLEGRIAIIVDGTPVVLTVPYLFIENFQSNDDYYLNFYFASIGRILRLLGFLLTTSIPAIYISLITYHREMIPTPLALSIAEARQGVPLPSIVECLAVLFIFQIIRETGLRMPAGIGQALSIVGALVIGQAAVEAKMLSAPMIIIVATTAITGLINMKLQGASIIISMIFLLASAVLGFYGYFIAVIGFLIHILSLTTFGVEYTSQMLAINLQESKDIYIRAPWDTMNTRPLNITKNKTRSKKVRENKNEA